MRKVTEKNEMGDKKINAKGVSPHLIWEDIKATIKPALGRVACL
jgi:hypothetical protein